MLKSLNFIKIMSKLIVHTDVLISVISEISFLKFYYRQCHSAVT